MAIKSAVLVGDFETTTDPEDARVWAVGLVDIATDKTVYTGTSIDGMFDYLSNMNTICYFHNLSFDGEWILSYLLHNNYRHVIRKRDENGKKPPAEPRTFETIISDMGQFYSITVYFDVANKKFKKVEFRDSLKKLPFSVARIADAFNLKLSKLEIDYDEYRPVGHELTELERDYLEADIHIVAQALKSQFNEGLNKMSIGADALSSYKKIIGQRTFERQFPTFSLQLDHDLRGAYRGGFTYLNPRYANKRGLTGITLDVNSLYPAMQYYKPLPYGYPVFFEGEPNIKEGDDYNIYIAKVQVCFDLKKDHIPTIQLKSNPRFRSTHYIESSEGDIVEMILTNVDIELLKDHYDTSAYFKYVCGWKFKSRVGMFKEYIDYWMHIKETSEGGRKQLAKLQLNNLYGKFNSNPKRVNKIPYLDEDGVVRYSDTRKDPDFIPPVYSPVGTFITAYARDTTIRAAQRVYDRFIYADTDSLKLIGDEPPEGLEIHPTKLGAWKNEGWMVDSVFIKPKTYMCKLHEIKKDTLKNYVKAMCNADECYRESDGIHTYTTHVTCAGMPDNIKANVTFDNFKPGTTFQGKLKPKRVKGGIVLVPGSHTIT